jgi:hypothetical protein
MRTFGLMLGMVAGGLLALLCCEPVYDLLWPGATDKRDGSVGFFLAFMLAPTFMIVGAIIGAAIGGKFWKNR